MELSKEQKRTFKEIYDKLGTANFRLECGKRNAVMNVNSKQICLLYWAVQEYCRNRGFDVRGECDE